MLATYAPEEVVALLSCFVFQEKTDVEPTIPPKLEEGRDAVWAVAARVGEVQDRHKVAAPDADAKLKFGLMKVVYEWANGMVSDELRVRVVRLSSSCLVLCIVEGHVVVSCAGKRFGVPGYLDLERRRRLRPRRAIPPSLHTISYPLSSLFLIPLLTRPNRPKTCLLTHTDPHRLHPPSSLEAILSSH